MLINNIFHSKNRTVIRITDYYALLGISRMYNLTLTDIQPYMGAAFAIVGITNYIPRLNLTVINTPSGTGKLSGGSSADRIPEVRIDKACKSGTIRATCKTAPAVYISIAKILHGVIYNIGSKLCIGYTRGLH